MELQSGAQLELIAQELAEGLSSPRGPEDFNSAVEHFVAKTLLQQGFPVAEFAQLLHLSGLSFVRLYSLYVGKNVLNFFRQDHGYKEGTYRKIWQGREDNEHLVDILARVDVNALDYKEQIYSSLKAIFASP